jgi:exosortase/archaeosortase family protein
VVAMLSMRLLWKRALMLLATFPLAICGNILRLTVVVLIGQAYGQAEGKWVHDWFGYVTYLAVNIGALLGLAHLLREKPSPTSA